jgi:UDP-glucose 4-epimerase
LVADATRARNELNWKPVFAELAQIVAHAWAWEQKHEAWRKK